MGLVLNNAESFFVTYTFMKTSLLCGAALAILALASAPVLAQTQPTTSPSATVSPSAAATASAAASASPGKATRATPDASPVSPRHKGDQMTKGTSKESAAETTGSPSHTKSSKKSSRAEKATGSTTSESSAETGASLSGKKSSKKKGATESETAPTPGGEQE
jgi:hypothetical protein